MENISDQAAVAIVIFGSLAFMSFMAWREDRINKKTDAAYRAGYEQGLKVVQRNVR